MDFGKVVPGPTVDMGKVAKLAQRVEKVLHEYTLYKEPRQLDPQTVLVSPCNRDGASPNVHHVHGQILRSLFEHGFDSTRPQVGICVECKSPEKKRQLLEHNQRFQNSLLPLIDEDKAAFGSIASTHLNLALRLCQQGAHSPSGDLQDLTASNHTLRDVVRKGHKWWILKEDTPPEDLVAISLWRNQDQVDNQGTHEIEILQGIIATAGAMRKHHGDGSSVPLADLAAKAGRRMTAKIAPKTMNALCKFFSQFIAAGHQHLLQELLDFHAMTVNPKELVVPLTFL